MNIVFCTSFSKSGYTEYGKKFLQGWINHFPKSAKLIVFYEQIKPNEEDPRITYFDLLQDQELLEFLKRHAQNPAASGVVTDEKSGKQHINYRFQATKFARKVFAETSPLIPQADWTVWIDSDVEVRKHIPMKFFEDMLTDNDAVAYYIGRDEATWHHSELGFAAYNTATEAGRLFLKDFRETYKTDKVFTLQEWHDSFVFDEIRRHYEAKGKRFVNIAEGIKAMHPWVHTSLEKYMTHHKGPAAKQMVAQGQSGIDLGQILTGCQNRYEQILRMVDAYKPKVILEVGTNEGNMAFQMLDRAFQYHDDVKYIGFDIFESGNDELNVAENNAKGNPTLASVEAKFQEYAKKHPGLKVELVPGNTRDTLPNYDFQERVDFAFVDGGHSLETIESDYNAIKDHVDLIVFDDVYAAGVDVSKYGANTLLQNIHHIVLPIQDEFQNGSKILLAAAGPAISHTRANIPSGQPGKGGVQIKTRNCVPDEVIQENVRNSFNYTEAGIKKAVKDLEERLKLLKNTEPVKWLPPVCSVSDETLVLVGGSSSIWDKNHPEYERNNQLIKKRYEDGYKIIAVKTSYDHLMGQGILPWACFLLDPRDHVAGSIKNPDKKTIFFVSSMCNAEAWETILKTGARVFGYHAGVRAGEDKVIAEVFGGGPLIQGGTTSGVRGLNVLYSIGYRKFELFGFDSSYYEKPEKTHGKSPKEAIRVNVEGKEFWTDPELIAQSQDIEMFIKMRPDVDLKINGDGMLGHAANLIRKHIEDDTTGKIALQPGLLPYVNAFQKNDTNFEILTIDAAIQVLERRRKELKRIQGEQASFDEFLAK